MTSEERMLRIKILTKLTYFSEEMRIISEEAKGLITISEDNGEIKRLNERLRQIIQIIQNTDNEYDIIDNEAKKTLKVHLLEPKK